MLISAVQGSVFQLCTSYFSALIQGFSAVQVVLSDLIQDFSATQLTLSALIQGSALYKNFQELLVISTLVYKVCGQSAVRDNVVSGPSVYCIHCIGSKKLRPI